MFAATNADDCLAAVEERDRLVVLAFAVLDNEATPLVVGIDRQLATTTVATGIADKPGESVLSTGAFVE